MLKMIQFVFSGEPYRDMDTLRMAVRAAQLAKHHSWNTHQYPYYDRVYTTRYTKERRISFNKKLDFSPFSLKSFIQSYQLWLKNVKLKNVFYLYIESNIEQTCKLDETKTLFRGFFDFLQVTRYRNSSHLENTHGERQNKTRIFSISRTVAWSSLQEKTSRIIPCFIMRYKTNAP